MLVGVAGFRSRPFDPLKTFRFSKVGFSNFMYSPCVRMVKASKHIHKDFDSAEFRHSPLIEASNAGNPDAGEGRICRLMAA